MADDARGPQADKLELSIDHPPDFNPRYGYFRPEIGFLEAMIGGGTPRYLGLLEEAKAYRAQFAEISFAKPADPARPFWRNGWFPPLDGMALYALIARRKPETYIEIGSGNSTKFARKAITDRKLATRIVSIDPSPRVEIDRLVDTVVRQRLESSDLGILQNLGPNDIVFFDGSHRAFQNSDVTVFFCEVMPSLPDRCLVGFHDIFLPRDYPPEWRDRLYSEEYMLAAYLLGAGDRADIVFPCAFVSRRWQAEIAALLPPDIVEQELAAKRYVSGSAFWLQVNRGGPSG